jgi:hypothetical protein
MYRFTALLKLQITESRDETRRDETRRIGCIITREILSRLLRFFSWNTNIPSVAYLLIGRYELTLLLMMMMMMDLELL